MDVAVRELKAHLSAYLKRAAAGEILTVTDRGRPVATIGPVLQRIDLTSAIEAGWVTPPQRQGLKPMRRHSSNTSVMQVLAEDRGE